MAWLPGKGMSVLSSKFFILKLKWIIRQINGLQDVSDGEKYIYYLLVVSSKAFSKSFFSNLFMHEKQISNMLTLLLNNKFRTNNRITWMSPYNNKTSQRWDLRKNVT